MSQPLAMTPIGPPAHATLAPPIPSQVFESDRYTASSTGASNEHELGIRVSASRQAHGRNFGQAHLAPSRNEVLRNNNYARGTSWAIICIGLCIVTAFTLAYYYSGQYMWSMLCVTVLRTVTLFVGLYPILSRKNSWGISKKSMKRRHTFAILCILSLVAIVVAWILLLVHARRWPQVMVTVSDVFMTIGAAQMTISSAFNSAIERSDPRSSTRGGVFDLERQ